MYYFDSSRFDIKEIKESKGGLKLKYKGFDNYVLEEGEPFLRSCPECNPAHKHLMDTDYFHTCFQCGRSWIFGN